jgi:hypothetical protein
MCNHQLPTCHVQIEVGINFWASASFFAYLKICFDILVSTHTYHKRSFLLRFQILGAVCVS